MPEPGENESEKDFIARCIPMVMEDGTAEDEKQAAAICYSKWEKAKSLPPPVLDEALKRGARHSKQDRDNVRLIRKAAGEIHQASIELEPSDSDDPEEVEPEKTLVSFGGEIKALGNNRFGGYLVRFTTENDPDLTGEFFTNDTDFDMDFPGKATVYFNHGLDDKIGHRKFSKATLSEDEFGVWAETILKERDEYEKFLAELAVQGKLGWSSGTAAHLVETAPAGKANKITRWPLGLDASITHTPAESRNMVIPLKSYQSVLQQQSTATGEAEVATAAPSNGGGETVIGNLSVIKEVLQMDITEEKLTEMIATAAKAGADAAIKNLPPINPNPGVQVVTDEADQPFGTWGDYFMAVKNAAYQPHAADKKLIPLRNEDKDGFYLPTKVAKPLYVPGYRSGMKLAQGLGEGVPADGGYLVTPQIAGGIVERMFGSGALLSRVAVDQIGPNSNGMVYHGVSDADRRDGYRWGGLLGYWLAEAGTKTATKPAFRDIELKLKKVAALCYATDELLADATALGSWIMRTVPEELRFKVEDAIFEGDGVGKPLGIMNSPALVSVLRNTLSSIVYQDVFGMYARRWVGSRNYVWLINSDCWPQLLALGSTYHFLFVPPGGLSSSPYGSLLGLPVIEVEFASTMGTVGDIVLADLSQYQTIQKGGVEAAQSIHVAFTTDETAFRFVYRIDGQTLWSSALTPFKGSNTQSPFVALATATA